VAEHDGAKTLIIEIRAGSPDDQYFNAKVKVLSEEIKYHVREEEKSDGVLAKAKEAGVATPDLAKRMATLKQELMEQAKAGVLGPPVTRSFRVRTNAGTNQLSQEDKMARGSSATMERERDERGRFVSDDDDDRDYRRRSSSARAFSFRENFTTDSPAPAFLPCAARRHTCLQIKHGSSPPGGPSRMRLLPGRCSKNDRCC
jgi:hypothetical protein